MDGCLERGKAPNRNCWTLLFMVSDLGALSHISRIISPPMSELIRSHLRDPQALNCLLMLLAAATLIAIAVAVVVVGEGRRKMLDWLKSSGIEFLTIRIARD
jgi:hypothetical protein